MRYMWASPGEGADREPCMCMLAVGGYMCACRLNKRQLMQSGSCDQLEGRRARLTPSFNALLCSVSPETNGTAPAGAEPPHSQTSTSSRALCEATPKALLRCVCVGGGIRCAERN